MSGDRRPWEFPPDPSGSDAVGPDSTGSDSPVTPHAAPQRDAQGRLTYVGEDGRRYIVGPPPDPQNPTSGHP